MPLHAERVQRVWLMTKACLVSVRGETFHCHNPLAQCVAMRGTRIKALPVEQRGAQVLQRDANAPFGHSQDPFRLLRYQFDLVRSPCFFDGPFRFGPFRGYLSPGLA